MMILKIEFAKHKCLNTIGLLRRFPLLVHIEQESIIKTLIFFDFYDLTPTWFLANFLVHIFDAWLRTICNAAVPDIPLHRYKRNWPITCDLPES